MEKSWHDGSNASSYKVFWGGRVSPPRTGRAETETVPQLLGCVGTVQGRAATAYLAQLIGDPLPSVVDFKVCVFFLCTAIVICQCVCLQCKKKKNRPPSEKIKGPNTTNRDKIRYK